MTEFWTQFGIWIGALCTLAIWSFLYKDNPFYKIAEQIFVGISAAYWFVYTIYNILIPNFFEKIFTDFSANWLLLIPGVLGMMMVLRIFPKLDFLGKYPLALMVGTTAGLGIIMYLKTDVLSQVVSAMVNPFTGGTVLAVLGAFILIVGTLSGLVYFFFSKKHEGFTGGVARLGIIFLMISFGASFGYTAMARISLLIGRLQFLLGDWLGILGN
ncbi:MAG: hypothetical protein FWG20_00895 [Candidatus Cloacimonetes bacterium]|nr:hypothetical protein [Candidatus Cloacimonadota bacterium]